MESTYLFNAVSPIAFVLILFFMDGMKIEITWFALLLAFMNAIVCSACTYFSIKALALGSLTNYSLWLMSGGMILPFLYGVLFESDTLGIAKIFGILLVLAAVIIKMDFKEKTDRKAILCFILLFILNGLVGVISSVYQSEQLVFSKVSSTQFSLLSNLCRVLVGAVMFGSIRFKKKKETETDKKTLSDYVKAFSWAGVGGMCNGIANLLLLIALLSLEPSLQYPMVTGGCIFLSAIFGLFFKEKLSRRAMISVVLAVVGTIVMAL